MSRYAAGSGDASAELQLGLSSLTLSDGTLNVARLYDSVSLPSTECSSDWTETDVTWQPDGQEDGTSDSTLTSGGGDWARRPPPPPPPPPTRLPPPPQSKAQTRRPTTQAYRLVPRRGGYGGHDISTVQEDSEGDATLRSAIADDAGSVVSRWSDFVSDDDDDGDFLTADDGGSQGAPPAVAMLRRLRELGEDPGPVTSGTAALYRRRLARLEARTADFSPELDAALAGKTLPPLELEQAAFGAAPPGGMATRRSCFNYLLLDPRVTSRRPSNGRLPLASFAAAVFYVGKGQQSRPFCHLREAADATTADNAKVAHIRAIWRSGAGVVLLSVFHHRQNAESLTREAAMIDAIGLRNLTNVRRGDYYGASKAWTVERRRGLGVALLHRAWRIYAEEGETQLRPEDLGL